MNIIENIRDSLKYPTKDWVKIIVLGIILIIPIVNFIGLGYYLRILKSSLAGFDELPEFERIGELFIDGIKVLVVFIIYAIIPLIFFVLSLAIGFLTTEISWIFLILSIIFAFIMSIFAYMGVANMAYNNSEIGAALRYHEILDIIAAIGWGNYILWWIAFVLIITIAGFIVGIIGVILLYFVLGIVFCLVGYSYLTIFQARFIAMIFISSRDI